MTHFNSIRKDIMETLLYAVPLLSHAEMRRAREALYAMDDEELGRLYDRNKLTESFWKKELLK